MSAYPRVVTQNLVINWGDPPGTMRLHEGELIDVKPGSALAAAIGAANLRNAVPGDYIGHGALSN